MSGDQLSQRVGTAEREQALGLLGKALEEGYLSLDEYEQRMTVVTAAKTAYELTRSLSDLPPRLRWFPQRPGPEPPAGAPGKGTTPDPAHATATASLVLGLVSLPTSLCLGSGALVGIAAVVLSRPGLRSRREHGKATVGLATGLVGIALSLVFLALIFLAD